MPQNLAERAYKLFSRLENNYITSLKDFYAVLWGALYRVLREFVPCWKAFLLWFVCNLSRAVSNDRFVVNVAVGGSAKVWIISKE